MWRDREKLWLWIIMKFNTIPVLPEIQLAPCITSRARHFQSFSNLTFAIVSRLAWTISILLTVSESSIITFLQKTVVRLVSFQPMSEFAIGCCGVNVERVPVDALRFEPTLFFCACVMKAPKSVKWKSDFIGYIVFRNHVSDRHCRLIYATWCFIQAVMVSLESGVLQLVYWL